MRWNTAWGANAKRLATIQKSGRKVAALDDRPPLLARDFCAWELFTALSQSRPVGTDVGAIQLSEFLAACELYDIPACERAWYWGVIRAVDAAWLEARSDASSKAGN